MSTVIDTVTPEGYMRNGLGHLVPKTKVKDIDILRDDMVLKTISQVHTMQSALSSLKDAIFGDINAFLGLAAEQYSVEMGSTKGNLSLMSYDGRFKVQVAVEDIISFNENLHVAKALIDQCIHRWVQDSNDNIRALVEHAFRTDKQGNISITRVLSLLQLKITDPDWEKAMAAIRDSIQATSSKKYLRFYRRVDETQKYEQISLDFAGV